MSISIWNSKTGVWIKYDCAKAHTHTEKWNHEKERQRKATEGKMQKSMH